MRGRERGGRGEYDAELEELARKTAEVRAQAAALEREKAHAAALEQDRGFRSRDEMPLIYWFGWAIADKTRGSARLDLVRPRFPAVEPGNLLRRLVAPTTPSGTIGPAGGPRSGWRHDDYDYNDRPTRFGRFGFSNFGQGARIKLMRHIDFGTADQIRGRYPHQGAGWGWKVGRRRREREVVDVPSSFDNPDFNAAVTSVADALSANFKPPEKPWFDFGAGLNLELDKGALRPTVRLKVKDFFSIKLLPEPMFKIQKALKFSPKSHLGLRINYELPLIDARNLWAPPARLMVRFDNHMGGVRVGPGGADFDDSILQLGKSTAVRAALGVDFPNSLPVEEGSKLFSWRARRLGVKTQW